MRAFEEIASRFNRNMGRVENLIRFYDERRRENPENAHREQDEDILRAALVFLHATLEDFLRSVLAWRLPESSADEIDKIPLLGQTQKTPSKFNLGSLAAYKDLNVGQLIRNSIYEHLEKWVSFNDVSQIQSALRSSGIILDGFDFGTLASVISRRHEIVHRADTIALDAMEGSLSPIDVDTLRIATEATQDFFDCTSLEIKKSFYLPQAAMNRLLEHALILAEHGSVSLKDWTNVFDKDVLPATTEPSTISRLRKASISLRNSPMYSARVLSGSRPMAVSMID